MKYLKKLFMQKIHGEAMYTALTLRSACSHSSCKPAMCGVKGQSPLRSLGGPRGPFSHVREWPPYPCSAIGAASPSRAVRGKLPHPLGKSKKCNFF